MTLFSFVFALIPTGIGLWMLRKSFRLRRHGRLTTGTIEQVVHASRGGPAYRVRYETRDRKQVEFNAEWGGLLFQKGDAVPVLYLPAHPRVANIALREFMWVLPVAMTGFGLCCLAFAIYVASLG